MLCGHLHIFSIWKFCTFIAFINLTSFIYNTTFIPNLSIEFTQNVCTPQIIRKKIYRYSLLKIPIKFYAQRIQWETMKPYYMYQNLKVVYTMIMIPMITFIQNLLQLSHCIVKLCWSVTEHQHHKEPEIKKPSVPHIPFVASLDASHHLVIYEGCNRGWMIFTWDPCFYLNNTCGEGQTPGLRAAPKLLLSPKFAWENEMQKTYDALC